MMRIESASRRRLVVLVTLVSIVLLALVVLSGFTSANPDGLEWSLFDFAGLTKPDTLFAGVWAIIGEGPLVEALSGAVGVLLVLGLAYLVFWHLSRRG